MPDKEIVVENFDPAKDMDKALAAVTELLLGGKSSGLDGLMASVLIEAFALSEFSSDGEKIAFVDRLADVSRDVQTNSVVARKLIQAVTSLYLVADTMREDPSFVPANLKVRLEMGMVTFSLDMIATYSDNH